MMKSPFHHIRHAQELFDHFHKNVHHAFFIFVLAMIGMLRGVSHILTPTSASRQRWGFITSDFRDQHPTNENITYALFGDGTPGSTAYTRLRDSSCIPTSVQYISALNGLTWSANTIYIVNSWSYTLTYPITLSSCSALIGRGDVYIKSNTWWFYPINAWSSQNQMIIDNIKINWNNITTRWINFPLTHSNSTINNIDVYQTTWYGIYLWSNTTNINLYNSRFYNNTIWIYTSNDKTINNCQFFNNTLWIDLWTTSTQFKNVAINNSQIYNNERGIQMWFDNPFCLATICPSCTGTINYSNSINNSTIYNNVYGIYTACFEENDWWTNTYSYTYHLNNTNIYNNNYGIRSKNSVPTFPYYWTLNMFSNTNNTWWADTLLPGAGFSISSWADGSLDTTASASYDRVTNPQNGSWNRLLSWNYWNILQWPQWFNVNKRPIRYIFWLNILKQIKPVWYHASTLEEYGINWADYKTINYIAEPESALSIDHQAIVQQYFWSGSIYTQNRTTNGCSLSAFQVKTLDPWTFYSTNNTFEDHTIYILSGGEYKSAATWNAFVFNGNCIALVGADDTIFTKLVASNMLYANNKHNIIIDNVKIDWTHIVVWNTMLPNNSVVTAIKFNGTTNNNTINDVQAYNTAAYGIYLGLGSHHNTLMNVQTFNNNEAGIHLYYASNYNVINNTQSYNNWSYGIRFANGSSRNTMNNFQAYNNGIGLFWDLTTQENILNRAAIYNNSDAGIYFKNSSGNILNDVRIYNNTIGIRTLYSSPGNKYYGELKMFANVSGNFEGTTGNDMSFAPWSSALFSLPGTLNTGGTMSCLYATNPTLSGSTLLNSSCSNTGHNIAWFISPYDRNVNYAFGLNIYKQAMPKRYETGGTLTSIPSQYDANKYIAEVFAIRDDDPEEVYFDSTWSAELHSRYSTNIYTAGVLNISIPITLTLSPSTATWYLVINWTSLWTTGMISNGDTIQVKVLSATGYNQTITGTLTLGSVTTWFTVTTRGINQLPTTGSFAFTNMTSIPLNTITGSSTIVAGLETGVYASISFSPSITTGWVEIYSWSTFISSGTTGQLVYNGNRILALAQSSSGYAQTVTGNVTIWRWTGTFTLTTKWSDSTPPTTPTLTYPMSGEEMFFITFEWTASTDTGAWIAWYEYQIAEDTNFLDIINTGFITTTTTWTAGSPNTSFDETSWLYYRRIRAKDRDDNVSNRSNTWTFEVTEFDGREFAEKTNANLRTYYESDEITLEGIKAGLSIWASVDNDGTIYKNGTDRWTGVYVQNDDELYLSVRSSNNYDRTISATLKIANRILDFDVTTKDESDDWCTLTSDDEETIQTIFDSLVNNYSWDEDRYDEFLTTMQSMLEDEIDFTNDCNLEYLQNLIEEELGIPAWWNTGWWTISTWSHIAPNCKEYAITYDAAIMGYTSPNLSIATFFANRDSLTRYIDSKNPGDCHINTYGVASRAFTNTDPSKHIAPNGKIYFITMESGKYTSSNFIYRKYFTTLAELRTYIDKNNITSQVRSHQVDTSFTPQTFTAPNMKEYKIYKTDRWYMSYKLMKVQYFSSLTDIQSYINRNNPR